MAVMLTAGVIGQASAINPGVSPVAINASLVLLVAIVKLAMGLLFLGNQTNQYHNM